MPATTAEDDLIARHFAPLAGAAGLGLRDDAALLRPPEGCDLVVTTDALIAGVHFFLDDPLDGIGKKALRVNLSDLAAKGAEPLGFLLALALPRAFDAHSLSTFADGLGADARAFHCPLIGGDTVSTPGPLTISITALGSVPQGAMVPRTGAKPGDLIYVTGTIGDAALALRARLQGADFSALPEHELTFLRKRYLLPTPRLALGAALRAEASAAMDVSDGFVGDLRKMLRVSGLGGRIWLSEVPLSEAAREAIARAPALFDVAVTGGDDYEIVCAIDPERAARFEEAAAAVEIPIARVGEATGAGEAAIFLDAQGAPCAFAQESFSHI